MKRVIGERIRKLREQHGYSLKEVGERINYDRSNLLKVEQGKINASTELIAKLSDLFGVNTGYFFGDEIDIPKELEEFGVYEITIAREIRDSNLNKDDIEQIKNFIKFIKQNKK